MFAEHLNETMRRFVNELKLNRQRKQAAAARGRAIDCMELEDRILLSASPIAPTVAGQQDRGRRSTDRSADSQGGGRRRQRQPRRRLVEPERGRKLERQCPAVQFGRRRAGKPDSGQRADFARPAARHGLDERQRHLRHHLDQRQRPEQVRPTFTQGNSRSIPTGSPKRRRVPGQRPTHATIK